MPYRLLLADDSLTIQKVVELTFPDPDYELLAVGNGNKALEALESFRPDIVLADVVMPGPPGYDVCEAVRKLPGGSLTPVVLLTGTFEPFDRARADRVGATAVVTKPFDSHALASLVRDLLQKAAEERAAAESAPPPPPVQQPFTPAETPKVPESAAADLFAEEPVEPDELYATSAIAIPSLASIAPPPPVEAAHHVEAPVEPEPVVEEPIEIAEEEPLPPPPPFDSAPAVAEAPWELADAPAEPPLEEVPPAPVEETTQPLPAAPPPPIAFVEEPLEPPPPFEVPEPSVAESVHGATTPTAIINPPREPEQLAEPPVYLEEPEPPAPPEPEPEPEPGPAVTARIPALAPPEPPPVPLLLEEQSALPPAPVSEPEPELEPELEPEPEPAAEMEPMPAESGDEVFAMEGPGEETIAVPPPPPPPLPSPSAPEPPEPLYLEQEEPVARDIDEDIAAFESGGQAPKTPRHEELEELAAGVSLSDLIPPPPPPAPAAPLVERPIGDDEIEKIARRVAELIGERIVRDIAWEVVPELAERLVRERLAEIERE